MNIELKQGVDELFGSKYPKRGYIFGGYNPKMGYNSDSYKMQLTTSQCGAGYYSTRARLFNAPRYNSGDVDADTDSVATVGDAYQLRALMKVGAEQSGGDASGTDVTDYQGHEAPVGACCPLASDFYRCCHPANEQVVQGWIDDTQANCYKRYDCQSSDYYCGTWPFPPTIDTWILRGSRRPHETGGLYLPQLFPPEQDALTQTVRIRPGLSETEIHEAMKYVDDHPEQFTVLRKKLQDIRTHNLGIFDEGYHTSFKQSLFHSEYWSSYDSSSWQGTKIACWGQLQSMLTFWGPRPNCEKLNGGGNVCVDPFMTPVIRSNPLFWNKETQCSRCSRFGLLYYSTGGGYSSVCRKAGPGSSANSDATGIFYSELGRLRFTQLVAPSAPSPPPSQAPFTTDYRIEITYSDGTGPSPKPSATLKVTSRRVLVGGASVAPFEPDYPPIPLLDEHNNLNGTSSCVFDEQSAYLPSPRIRVARKCTLPPNVLLPVEWPEACSQRAGCVGCGKCELIASLVGVAAAESTAGWKHGGLHKAGEGDTRLFVQVALGGVNPRGATGAPPLVADPKATYYKDISYDGLVLVMGKTLTYELAVVRTLPQKGLACNMHKNRFNQDAAYNTFTYYYPNGGNYDLNHTDDQTYVDSYQAMAQEQQRAMIELNHGGNAKATEIVKNPSYRFPAVGGHGNSETVRVASCSTDVSHENVCTTSSPKTPGGPQYEALPQQLDWNAVDNGPLWPEKEWFGDYPNYDENDVRAGWPRDAAAAAASAIAGNPNYDPDSHLPTNARRVVAHMRNKRGAIRIRASAVCVKCRAGYEGTRMPTLIEGLQKQNDAPPASSSASASSSSSSSSSPLPTGGRYLRALFGPIGAKGVASFGIRTNSSLYSKVCQQCSPGMYSSRPGMSCITCPAGKFSVSSLGADTRLPRYITKNPPRRCYKCLKGFYCPRLGPAHFSVCNVTRYGNMCPCPLNTYQSERGQTTCTRCPDQSATAQAGSIEKAACKMDTVRPGFRFKGPWNGGVPSGGTMSSRTPVPCEPGTYRPNWALYSKQTTMTCTRCGRGRHAPVEGMSRCVLCPSGMYQDAEGATQCKRCAEDAKDACRSDPNCNANGFVHAGRTACTVCPVNTWAYSSYMTACSKCVAGTVRPNGSNTCAFDMHADLGDHTGARLAALREAMPDSDVDPHSNNTEMVYTDNVKDFSTTITVEYLGWSANEWVLLSFEVSMVAFPLSFVGLLWLSHRKFDDWGGREERESGDPTMIIGLPNLIIQLVLRFLVMVSPLVWTILDVTSGYNGNALKPGAWGWWWQGTYFVVLVLSPFAYWGGTSYYYYSNSHRSDDDRAGSLLSFSFWTEVFVLMDVFAFGAWIWALIWLT